MADFEKLEVWQKSVALSKGIYTLTRNFPDEEKFGLTNQMRRAAISIVSNIAEGSARDSDKDFARFITIAIGSTAELRAQAIVSKELNFTSRADTEQAIEEINRVARMLQGLKKSLIGVKNDY